MGRSADHRALPRHEPRARRLSLDRSHHSDPDHHRPPKQMPLSARELKLLFNGRAPDHHTKEMRDLRINYGFSRAERTDRLAALREGRIEPSEALKVILQEMKTRKTVNG